MGIAKTTGTFDLGSLTEAPVEMATRGHTFLPRTVTQKWGGLGVSCEGSGM